MTIRRPDHFEPHIQGLRAIAVLLVVIFHIWPGRLTGGYIGVDVFFVISGFLITGQLAREIGSTGRVRLGTFWAKRARRLLPAALLVIIVSAVLCLTLMPVSALPVNVRELFASTFYVENWALVASSTDYLAGSSESIAQHYWSLSLEEQFYIVWPLLLMLLAWLGFRAAGQNGRRRAIIWTIVVVAIGGYVVSGVFTQLIGPPAYFTNYTRMWEFAVGALVALLPAIRPTSRWLSAIVGWFGVVLVLAAGWYLNQQTAFPGWVAAIPVLGTALAIAARRSDAWWLPGRVLSIAPLRWIGDISYSLYLWHWPLIVVAPYIPGWPLQWWNRVILLIVSVLLAWATKRLVEDPWRGWRALTQFRARRTALASIALMTAAALAVGGLWAVRDPQYRAEAAELAAVQADPPDCFGAASLIENCANPALDGTMVPTWGFAGADAPDHPECFSQLNDPTVRPCAFGSTDPSAPRVALIGDSHAYQYLSTMISLAEQEGWSLVTYFKGACPWSAMPLAEGGAFGDACTQWQNAVTAAVQASPVDVIVTGAYSETAFVSADPEEVAAGYRSAWESAGAAVVAMRDNPHFLDDPVKCLRSTGSAADCTIALEDAVVDPDPLALAAEEAGQVQVGLTAGYCPDDECSPVIAGTTVYRDKDHLTVTWISTLAPVIDQAVDAALAS